MYCKNCGNGLNNEDSFCTNCGKKIDILNNLDDNKTSSQNNSNKKNNKTINIICKILLIFNFLFIVTGLLEGKGLTIFSSVMLLLTTIGILKTEEKRNNIFLILGIISISLAVSLPIIVMFGNVFIILFIKLFGGFKDISILDAITTTPGLIVNMEGGIFSLVVLIIMAISFIIIHKKQKKKH